MSSAKLFVSADHLLNDSFALGQAIIASGFIPDVMLALWRGGTPVGVAVQELFTYLGYKNRHFPLKTSHYHGIDSRHDRVTIEGLDTVLNELKSSRQILIVDDVFDTGITIDRVMAVIEEQVPGSDVRAAVPYFKPKNNLTERVPDYFLHTTDQWIVFPHELAGLTEEEILKGKPELAALQTLLSQS
jgi:Predicted phosphoribosyltransferases